MTSTDTKTLLPVVYEQNEQTLVEAAARAKALKKIVGVEDRAGYEAHHRERMALKGLRVAIEKQRVDLKAGALDYGRRVDAEARRLTALVEPTELELEAEQKRIDGEKERIRAEAEAARKAKLDARVSAFVALGIVNVSASALAEISDADFDEMLKTAQAEHAARVERERIAAEEAAFEAAEQQRREAEAKRIETERLAKEREELARLRSEQAAAQKRLDDEAARVREEQRAAQAKLDAERAAFEAEREAAKVKPAPVVETPPLFPEVSEAGPVEPEFQTEDECEAEDAAKAFVRAMGTGWDAPSFAAGYLAGLQVERARRSSR